jgi:hypothetical protein
MLHRFGRGGNIAAVRGTKSSRDRGAKRLRLRAGLSPHKETAMAKGQKKSNKEVRKPKAEKAPKANASNPTTKGNPVGIVNIKG